MEPPPETGGGGSGGTTPPPPPDEDNIEVKINLPEPLSPKDAQALADLEAGIARMDQAIKALPDNARLVLPDGKIVDGAELKAAWAKTDFEINPQGTVYPNGTPTGSQNSSANYNGGNPEVNLNIDFLKTYAALGVAGVNYFLLHEAAHFTQAQRDNWAAIQRPESDGGAAVTGAESNNHERLANDIARAIANHSGAAILTGPNPNDGPGPGYTPGDYGFIVPTPPTPPSGGGGGGGFHQEEMLPN